MNYNKDTVLESDLNKEIGERFGYWMVKFYSVSDSKSGIQFGFAQLWSTGKKHTHRHTKRKVLGEKKTDRKDRDIRTNTDEPTHG